MSLYDHARAALAVARNCPPEQVGKEVAAAVATLSRRREPLKWSTLSVSTSTTKGSPLVHIRITIEKESA